MQFARVIYQTPPSRDEGGLSKIRRKLGEWWLAPVIYRELTRGGDDTLLKQWAANHIWLAQRTGGQPLHGVEVTSQVVFGKEAKDLSTAEQFVLASAVNKPIILLEGNDRLNAVRLDRWRYITEVRARICAEKLITDEAEQKKVVFELMALAGGPPDPKVKPKLASGARTLRARSSETRRGQPDHPRQPAAAGGALRHPRGDEAELRLRLARLRARRDDDVRHRRKPGISREDRRPHSTALDTKWSSRIDPAYTLDPKKVTADKDAAERHRRRGRR